MHVRSSAHLATLIYTCLHAHVRACEDQVRCVVALAVTPTPADRIPEAVRVTRLALDMRWWNHEAAGAAVPAPGENLA